MKFLSSIASSIILTCILFLCAAPCGAQAPQVVEIQLEGMIHPVTAEFVTAGIDQATQKNASLIVIQINTPGGLDTSMRQIIEKIISSPVPVAVYVAPSGSRAASAGFFILLSSDIAAMAPGTNSGAAHPVFLGGETDEVMKQKVANDAAAYLRSFVTQRHRNSQLAEKGVTESRSFTDGEALQGHLIDMVAEDLPDLLKKLDGFEVTRFDGKKQVLHLQGATVEVYTPSTRQEFLSHILDPNIAFILLILGILGLYVEFTHPGLILPGVAGGISLILSLFALSLLPINWAGAALIVLAIAFFVLEAKFATHGILAAGGVAAMILGAMMLINTRLPGGRITLVTALSVAVPFGGITIFLLRLVMKARALKVATGQSALIGEVGNVQSDGADGRVKVYVQGELWDAVSPELVSPGAQVQVTAVDGLTLHVVPVNHHEPGAPEPEPKEESSKGARN